METKELFEKIYKENYESVFKYIYISTQNKTETEDIVQDAFLEAYKNIENCKGEYKAWVYKIARNKMLDRFKSYDNKNVSKNNTLLENITSTNTTENEIDKKALYSQMLLKINDLAPDQKEAFVLKFMQEMEYPEIASIMNKTENAVRILISKAMQILRLNSEEEKKKYIQLGAFLPFSLADSYQNIKNNILSNKIMNPTAQAGAKASVIKIASITATTAVIAGGGIGYLVGSNVTKKDNQTSSVTTQTPIVTTTSTTSATATPTVTNTTTPTADPYMGWNTYKNSKYGYTVRYPSNWAYSDKGELSSLENVQFALSSLADSLNRPGDMPRKLIILTNIDAPLPTVSDSYREVVISEIMVDGVKATEYKMTQLIGTQIPKGNVSKLITFEKNGNKYRIHLNSILDPDSQKAADSFKFN